MAGTESRETLRKFAESLDLDYPILSDADKSVAKAYGVVHGIRIFPERWTFYIGKDGTIVDIDKQVLPGNAADMVLYKLKELHLE